ncbi:MAG: alpha/beta hydrolase [Promethearchaeota archaeon]
MIDIAKLRSEIKEPHYLIETSDNKVLFLRSWETKKPSKVGILIFHGITAHSKPYEQIAKPLSSMGFNVYGLDLRGHGLSDGIRGDYKNKEQVLNDLKKVIQFLKEKNEKIILWGHSMGVIVTFFALEENLSDVDGIILMGAGTKIKPGVYQKISFSTKMKILFSSIFKPNKPVISYYREGMVGLDDPLFNFKYTLRFMKIFNLKNLKIPEKLEVPVIIAIGDNDEIFSIDSARDLFDKIPCSDKNLIIMPNTKHAEFSSESFKELFALLMKKFNPSN